MTIYEITKLKFEIYVALFSWKEDPSNFRDAFRKHIETATISKNSRGIKYLNKDIDSWIKEDDLNKQKIVIEAYKQAGIPKEYILSTGALEKNIRRIIKAGAIENDEAFQDETSTYDDEDNDSEEL